MTKKSNDLWNKYKNKGEKNHRRVLNREITSVFADVSVDEPQYDPDNPRLQNKLQGERNFSPTQAQLHKAILEMNEARMGRFIECLDVSGAPWDNPLLDANGLIKEGNLRTYACRERFHKLDDARFETMRVEIFPPDVTDKEWDAILDIRHISNQIEWDSIDCCAKVAKNIIEHHETVEECARRLGWTLKQVKNYLKAYQYVEGYRKKFPKAVTPADVFTKCWKLANSPKLQKMLDPESEDYSGKDLEWFYKMLKPTGKLERGHLSACLDVVQLPRILNDAKALKLLEGPGEDDRSPSRCALEYLAGLENVRQRRTPLAKAAADFLAVLKKVKAAEINNLMAAASGKGTKDERQIWNTLDAINIDLGEICQHIHQRDAA